MTEITTTNSTTRISDVDVDTGVTFARGDAEADHVALARAGVCLDPLLHRPGVPRMFVGRDPDGNRFKVMEPALR